MPAQPMPADSKHRVFLPMDDRIVIDSPPNWTWNKANAQSVGGGFAIDANLHSHYEGARTSRLRFYVGARTGVGQLTTGASTGFADLRRDGFASVGMDTPSSSAAESMARLVTRPLRFIVTNNRQEAWLFINAEHADKMRFSLLDEAGAALPGLSENECTGPSAANGEQLVVGWVGGAAALGASRSVFQFIFPQRRRDCTRSGLRRQRVARVVVGLRRVEEA